MDGSRLPRFPHLSWLQVGLELWGEAGGDAMIPSWVAEAPVPRALLPIQRQGCDPAVDLAEQPPGFGAAEAAVVGL